MLLPNGLWVICQEGALDSEGWGGCCWSGGNKLCKFSRSDIERAQTKWIHACVMSKRVCFHGSTALIIHDNRISGHSIGALAWPYVLIKIVCQE